MKSIFQFVSRHPWLYVVLAFGVLIAAWTTLILIATLSPNQEIEVSPAPQRGQSPTAGPQS